MKKRRRGDLPDQKRQSALGHVHRNFVKLLRPMMIEDDQDDRDFLRDIFESLDYPNLIVFFKDSCMVQGYLLDAKKILYDYFRY